MSTATADAPRTASAAHGFPIRPESVRYIKLGTGGEWERECLENGIVRFGFGSANAERFALCRDGKWEQLTQSFLADGRTRGTATHFTNETRAFFEDRGSTLWITFHGGRLYWGFLTEAAASPHPDGNGTLRHVDGGWRSEDASGKALTKDRLSGKLTKLAGYKGTSCTVHDSLYAIRRINGEKSPEYERAEKAFESVRTAIRGLIGLLDPYDFETLVDLVFAKSGWTRLGPVGRTEKTIDIDLCLPTTGEKAFVQVKSATSSSEIAKYVAALDEMKDYKRMFFVFHTGEAESNDERVRIIGPDRLADMVLEAGLVTWLFGKVA